ncbi:YraN family protein [Chondromyces crocatus]|uniref:UPF0102 protein CMC5_084890 n=1 Tax=Chondromyces crocatus TaxID=52 RepID=A0A0K1ELV3_CHOCO|nr:uncharacterized protein CMC5_084890 [Chondromyces crocatus]
MTTPYQQLGVRAECIVAEHLTANGLRILGRNIRVGRIEIDIVAQDEHVIAIIEVRTRGPGSYVRPLDSIDSRKRARLRRAGTILWERSFSRISEVTRMRFDVAAVHFQPDAATIEYIKAAF